MRRAKAESLREDGDSVREDGDDAVSELRQALVERLQNMCPDATEDACHDALDDCGDDEEEALAVLLDVDAWGGRADSEEFLRRLADAMAASEEERVADVEADVIQDSMEAEEARAEAAAQQEEHLRLAKQASMEAADDGTTEATIDSIIAMTNQQEIPAEPGDDEEVNVWQVREVMIEH